MANMTMLGITVTGSGKVTGSADIVELDLGVSVLGGTVREAASRATEKATALLSALADGGIDRKDITTADYSIHPEYDYSSNQQKLIGYRVDNTVRVAFRDLEATGSIIDSAAAAGGDDVRVNGIRFSIEDDAALVMAARALAWDDAMAKATQLAELAGRSLGAATTIEETTEDQPVPVFRQRMMAAEAAQTPIEPGVSTVAVTLRVNFAFED